MKRIRATAFRPRPLPCRHDRRGVPHASLSAILLCVERYGVPGFEITEAVLR